ncbi:putative uncharacterized protein [Brachyspira sp. CAG:484]|nr:putative uncharacterized protein [Brachyspira sp. CAG:484]
MGNEEALNKNNIFNILLIIVLAVGCILRILFYSYSRPFWNDECALALNILNTWNYFKPLEYGQAAPQLFMYGSKLAYYLLPSKELALRIIPLFSSLGSLIVFYLAAKRFLIKHISLFSACLLFSICYPLCDYAQQFKPYSTDVLISLLVILSYFYIDKFVNLKTKLLYGLFYGLAIWFSFPSVFTVISVYLTYFIFNPKKFKQIAVSLLPFGISLAGLYIANANLMGSSYLHNYWQYAFINKGFWAFMELLIDNIGYVFGYGLPLFLILISILFMVFKDDNRRESNFLLCCPVLIVLICSYFEIYPFSTRLILFLIPVFILLGAKLFDYINIPVKCVYYTAVILLSLMLIAPASLYSFNKIFLKTYDDEDIVTALKLTQNNIKKEDVIYISDGNSILYEYYKRYFNFSNPVITDEVRFTSEEEYVNHLNSLPKGVTYYWIFAHHPNKMERLQSVYKWARNKQDFRIYHDNKSNALIIFTM